ncbi:MAG: CheY-like REC domain [Thermodesulfobacteria bacterium]|nr:response regulator [Thermodesulfobacteriota bacterium]MCU4138306.1 CheY-like REC domain [Thermodesulfobacteriota bacterium]
MFPSEKKEILEIFKNLKVLIIDEDEFIFKDLSIFLKKFIPNLYICISPNQTLEIIKNNNFDLLVINYWMSHINGFELVNFFKKRNPDAGIILLTSEDKPLSKEIINIGIDKYILKTNYEETNKELLKAIEEMSERKFLKASLLKRREAELKSFQVFHKYLRYQQEKGLKKQKNIIKDDLAFSTYLNKIPFAQKFFYFQTFYKPLEIISGDIYSLRIIKNNKIFLFLMDVKEKGIPASITASSTTTFLNYLIDILLRIKIKESLYTYKDYFKFLIKEFLEYIKTYLLEDEALCILFLLMDLKNNKVLIANFGIPSIYIIKDSNLKRIPPQNLPILTSTETFKIDSLALSDIDKIIIASDGILSCKMKNSKLYITEFEKDLLNSSYLNEWRNLFEKKVERISDDITLIYINSCKIDGFFKKEFKIKSNLTEIDKFLSQVYRRLKKSKYFNFLAPKIVTILNEILLNAHEHGTLEISSLQKEKKIIEGSYENFLQQLQPQQQIIIKFVLSLSKKELYIIVEDKGKGFKKSLIENTLERTFSGFGLKIIKHLCKDFFFNKKGNTIVVIVDIKRK